MEKQQQEIENKKQKREQLKAIHKEKEIYLSSLNRYIEVGNKTEKELTKQATIYWKGIQEMVRDDTFSYLKVIRTKVDFCKVILKADNSVIREGTTKEIYEKLYQSFFEILRDCQWQYNYY